MLADLRTSPATITAGLLHDLLGMPVDRNYLIKEFGEMSLKLEGVTKLVN